MGWKSFKIFIAIFSSNTNGEKLNQQIYEKKTSNFFMEWKEKNWAH